MTSRNIFDAMRGIDAQLILDAAPAEKGHKKRSKTWIKWASLAACIGLVIGIALDNSSRKHDITDMELPTDVDNIIWGEDGVADVEIEDPTWNGWRVNYRLYTALENADENAFLAIRVLRSNVTELDHFVYEGKTYAEIRAEIYETETYCNKLGELMKDGECLKYGELIYTTGAPNGEKWAKSLYEERMAYYGEEILSTYIVDGELLTDALESAIEESFVKIRALEDAYEKAFQAYHKSYVNEEMVKFSATGACVIVRNEKLFIFVQKKQLSQLNISAKEDYTLNLAMQTNFEDYPANEPVPAIEDVNCS